MCVGKDPSSSIVIHSVLLLTMMNVCVCVCVWVEDSWIDAGVSACVHGRKGHDEGWNLAWGHQDGKICCIDEPPRNVWIATNGREEQRLVVLVPLAPVDVNSNFVVFTMSLESDFTHQYNCLASASFSRSKVENWNSILCYLQKFPEVLPLCMTSICKRAVV